MALTESCGDDARRERQRLLLLTSAGEVLQRRPHRPDQAESYAQRRGKPIEEVEKWLSPNLAYERAEAGVKC